MSLKTLYQLVCNICGLPSDLLEAAGPINARNVVRKQGWRLHEGNKDVCPGCVEEIYAVKSRILSSDD